MFDETLYLKDLYTGALNTKKKYCKHNVKLRKVKFKSRIYLSFLLSSYFKLFKL